MKENFIFGSFARFVILCTAFCSFVPASGGALAAELTAYAAVESFIWEEFDVSGARLLKERGPLFGLGFVYEREYENKVILRPAVELFGGRVDYRGQACDPSTGDCLGATSDVNYFGLKLEGDAGKRFGSPELYGEPFAGIGTRFWVRDIMDGTAADGSPTAGYAEQWFTMQARVGIRAVKQISENKKITLSAGVKLPLFNQSTAYLSEVGFSEDTTVKPGKKSSFFAEAGFRVNNLSAGLFYDSLRFSKSNHDLSTDFRSGHTFMFWQPESSMDLYGLKLGLVF